MRKEGRPGFGSGALFLFGGGKVDLAALFPELLAHLGHALFGLRLGEENGCAGPSTKRLRRLVPLPRESGGGY